MRNTDFFDKDLGDVPPVPGDAFTNIEKHINSATRKKQLFLALAASLMLSIGALTFIITESQNVKPVQTATSEITEDISDELQRATDFMNGTDIELEYNEVALLEDNN